MDKISRFLNFVPTILGCSNNKNVAVYPQEGNFKGVPVVPVLEGEQQSQLKSSLRSSSSRMEGGVQRPSKMVAFCVEDPEQRAGEVTIQALGRASSPGQEQIEKHSVAFARIQQQLNRKIKEISASDPKISAIRTELQTELEKLSEENTPETLTRRVEIKQQLKKLKTIPAIDPVKAAQIAQLYAEAYPEACGVAQQMLDWVQEDPKRQDESAVALLADITRKVIKMASKTVAPHEIKPIKRVAMIAAAQKQQIELPDEMKSLEAYENKKFPREDLQYEIIINTANDLLENLPKFNKGAPSLPDEKTGQDLQQDFDEKKNAITHTVSLIQAGLAAADDYVAVLQQRVLKEV